MLASTVACPPAGGKLALHRSLQKWARNPDHENVVIGCTQLLRQCGQPLAGWIDRRPERRRVLRQVLRRVVGAGTKPQGRKVVGDLVRFTAAVLDACVWREVFWLGAMPVEVVTEKQLAARRANAARATEARIRQREKRAARIAGMNGGTKVPALHTALSDPSIFSGNTGCPS